MDLRQAVALGRRLVSEHGLDGWSVSLDRAKTRAGACRFRTRQITLSRHLTALHSEDEVRDTILHEIAHALVGAGHGHDRHWRATALAIGCSGQRCIPEGAPKVAGSWVGRCRAGHEVQRHRRPDRLMSCTRCSRTFDAAHLLEWTHHGRPAPMHPNYAAQLAVLRGLPGQAGERRGPLERATAVVRPLRVGEAVRVTAPGRYLGAAGTIEKRGRTRYHVRVPEGLLTVPFALVEPVMA